MRPKYVLFGCVCLIVLVVLGGCGAGGGGGGQAGGQAGTTEASKPSGGAVIRTIEVKETEFRLDPANIKLDEPGTYVFKAVNSGGITHALEIEGQGIEEETENLSPGQGAELKVTLKAGTYEIYCPVDGHKAQGMDGTLTVGKGAGSQQDSGNGPAGGGGY